MSAAPGRVAGRRMTAAQGGGRKLAGQRIWLVGASSGIGAALAHELRSRGAHVAITARRQEQLEDVSGGTMTVV